MGFQIAAAIKTLLSLALCCGNLTGGCGTCRGFRVRPGAMLRRDRHAISGPGMICSSSSNKSNNKRTDSSNNSNKTSNNNANSSNGNNNNYTNDSNSINKKIECSNNNNNCSTTGPGRSTCRVASVVMFGIRFVFSAGDQINRKCYGHQKSQKKNI